MNIQAVSLAMHPSKPGCTAIAGRALRVFQQAGVAVYAAGEMPPIDGVSLPLADDETLARCDALVVLGGDGTLLRMLPRAVLAKVPILGINLGRVGFLTEVEQENLEEAFQGFCKGNYFIEERMLLHVSVSGQGEWLALNDAVVNRGGYSRLITMDAYISNDRIGRYVADGVVVASPTGSTAYSLSAGGPILSPNVPCMVVTPICAHTLQHRPVVVSAEETVTLRLRCEDGQGIHLTVDGQPPVMLRGDDQVAVRRAEETAKLIRLEEPRFFSLVRKKLTEWSC